MFRLKTHAEINSSQWNILWLFVGIRWVLSGEPALEVQLHESVLLHAAASCANCWGHGLWRLCGHTGMGAGGVWQTLLWGPITQCTQTHNINIIFTTTITFLSCATVHFNFLLMVPLRDIPFLQTMYVIDGMNSWAPINISKLTKQVDSEIRITITDFIWVCTVDCGLCLPAESRLAEWGCRICSADAAKMNFKLKLLTCTT